MCQGRWPFPIVVAVITISMVATACADASSDAGAPRPPAAGSVADDPVSSDPAALPDGWEICRNDRLGYSIGYPADWFTTDVFWGERDRARACTVFSSHPFDVMDDARTPFRWGPPVTEDGEPLGAIGVEGFTYPLELFFEFAFPAGSRISIEEGIERSWTPPARVEVLSFAHTEVAGLPAIRLERRVTVDDVGEGVGDYYHYFIQLDPHTILIASTAANTDRPSDYEGNKLILDRAMATLSFAAEGRLTN